MRAIGASEKIAERRRRQQQLAQRRAEGLELAASRLSISRSRSHVRRRRVEHVEPAKAARATSRADSRRHRPAAVR
jgi:hypothetical protein